jgi:hypothetical protein
LISHFEDEPVWTAEQLSNETNLPDHVIVQQMAYWVTQRVVLYVTPAGAGATSQPMALPPSGYDASKIMYTMASPTSETELPAVLLNQSMKRNP